MKQIISTAILFLCSITFYGQWTTDTDVNTLVVDSDVTDMRAIGASDGKTVVVYWEPVGAPSFFELRAQLLDIDGNQIFGSEGILISDQIPMSGSTQQFSLTIDAEDNFYIGVTGTNGSIGLAFKVDIDGNNLWGNEGVNLGVGLGVKILPLSDGGAIIGYFPNAPAQLQRVDANGDFVWNDPVTVTEGTSATFPSDLFEVSDGFVLIYHRLIQGINTNLFAQKFDLDGDSQWASSTQLSNNLSQFNRRYSGTQDGDVIYYGYSLTVGARFDSYLQRINPDGTIPWGINGSDFSMNVTLSENETRIALEEGSDFVWAITTHVNSSLKGVYVQKFDKVTGNREFTDNAKEVFPVTSDIKSNQGSLQLIDDAPFFLIEQSTIDAGEPQYLHAVLLDQNGDFAWQEETMPVATSESNIKSRTELTKPVNGQSVALFVEKKIGNTQDRIYAQNILVNEEQSCEAPSDIVIENETTTTAEVFWTENGEATMWEIIYGIEGFDPQTEGTLVEVEINPTVTLTNLEVDTVYEVYIRTICSEELESEWVGPESFTTETLSMSQNAIEGFMVYPNPATNTLNLTAKININEVTIININGQSVFSKSINAMQSQIDISTLNSGIYFLRVTSNKNSGTYKIIKK